MIKSNQIKQNNRKLIIFDLDDTLIYTHVVYLAITNEFIDKMTALDLVDDNLYYVLDSFDQENVEEAGGYVESAFPKAMVQTYEFYCQKLDAEYSAEIAAEIEAIGWQISENKYQVADGAKTLLDELCEQNQLILLTQGDFESQKRKVEDSGLRDYFAEVIIVNKKTDTVYKKIMAEHGYEPADTWIIGNSIKSEVNPAIRLGATPILVDITPLWNFEEEKQLADCIKVENLIDCLNYLDLNYSNLNYSNK